jgi:hypothetical protein
MKKYLLLLCFLPSISLAAGPYDGVWQTGDTTFTIINQNGEQVLATGVDLSDRKFTLSVGIFVGNTLTVQSIVDDGVSVNQVVFDSATSGTATLVSCTPSPGFECNVPIGTSIAIARIF